MGRGQLQSEGTGCGIRHAQSKKRPARDAGVATLLDSDFGHIRRGASPRILCRAETVEPNRGTRESHRGPLELEGFLFTAFRLDDKLF